MFRCAPAKLFHRRTRLRLVALWCALVATDAICASPDLRILIDVSGSMRHNDPANLRVPALKLLTALLPVGSTAGVWLFDQTTEC